MPLYNINSGPRGFLQPDDVPLLAQPETYRGIAEPFAQSCKVAALFSAKKYASFVHVEDWYAASGPTVPKVMEACPAGLGLRNTSANGMWLQNGVSPTFQSGSAVFAWYPLGLDSANRAYFGVNSYIYGYQSTTNGVNVSITWQDFSSSTCNWTSQNTNQRRYSICFWWSAALGQVGGFVNGEYQESAAAGSKAGGHASTLYFGGGNGFNGPEAIWLMGSLHNKIFPRQVAYSLSLNPWQIFAP